MIRLPRQDETIVWKLTLNLAPEDLAVCQAVLAAEEAARGARLLNPLHRRRHWAAWGQLRWLLAGCLGQAPGRLRFGRQAHGKPFLVGSDLHFNMSHSGDWLLVAVTWNRPVGVDVERIRPLSRMEALAEHCLAPAELAQWRHLDKARQTPAFFRFWTGKEAFIKADGRGLSLGVKRCVLALDPLRLLAVPEGCGRPQDWQMVEIDAGDPVRAALCFRGGPATAVQLISLPADWLASLRRRPVKAS